MIFVFGSNEAGIHGAGAARTAVMRYGAKMGKGVGLHGNSYAIPTKDRNIRTLPIERVAHYVQNFLDFATFDMPKLPFKVTCIGCGLAGFEHEQIAPMFKGAPNNCMFDELWKPWLGEEARYWGTF